MGALAGLSEPAARSKREAQRVRATLLATAITLIVASLVIAVVVIALVPDPGFRLAALGLVLAGGAGSIHLARRGRVDAGGRLLVATIGAGVTGGVLSVGNLFSPAIVGYPILVMVAGLLLGTRSAILTGLAVMAILAALGWRQDDATIEGLVAIHSAASLWWIQATAVAAATTFVCVAVRRTRQVLDEVASAEAALTRRNRELEDEVRTRERAEAALRANERRLRTLIEHSEDAITEIDQSGRMLFHTNPSRPNGLAGSELVGRKMGYLVHPEDRDIAARFARRLWTRGHARGDPFRCRTKDGEWRWFETSAATFRDDDGQRRAVAVTRDVTTRKRSEDRLRENEAFFRALAENVREIIAEYDRDKGLVYLSPRVEEQLGLAPEEILRSDPLERLHPDDVEPARRAFVAAFEESLPVEVRVRFRHRDGSWRCFDAAARPFESAAGAVRLVISARDVTEHLELEQRLRASQKLEAVARLAGGVAHDFNNLLTVMLGHTESLLGSSALDAEQRDLVLQVHESALRGEALVKQLLAFSRSQVLEPRQLDVNVVVSDMERLLRRLIGENVKLETRIGDGPLCVEADPSQLEQVIVNLTVNACDAIAGTGRVTIETAACEGRDDPTTAPGAGWVRLSVSDTGSGIDDQVVEHIFEPFFTTKQTGKGTGLGLATVHGIVEQSGGRIEVESKPGAGSVFRVFLPRSQERRSQERRTQERAAQAADAEVASPERAAGGAETILLVEDEPLVRRMVRRILGENGYRVLSATDGNHALEIARAHAGGIDLLLTDLVMPQMGGIELREKLVADRPGIRTLFMSGYPEHPSRSGVAGVAGTKTLGKPFRLRAFISAVREALDAPQAGSGSGTPRAGLGVQRSANS